ncbi:putative peptidoglycan glycosyltransferase FtsW [subsurface metagenome]|jgi:cell division protein FtsW
MQHIGIDRTLIFCLLCLVVLGIIFVYSSSYYRAMRRGEDSTFYLFGHLKRLAIASIFFFLGLIIPYEIIRKIIFPLLIIIVLVLMVTLIFGRVQYGARRSLSLLSTFGFQVSEFVRIWLVFFLANFFDSHPRTASTGKGMLTTISICLFVILLVAIQPSISMAVICFLILIFMLIYGSTKFRLLLPTMAISFGMLIFFVLVFPHARDRITDFVNHPTYQVQQSLIAIGSGGVFGKGPGAGLQKFLFLPRIHNDFIFSHVAEEFGFIGSLIVFVLYWQIYLRGLFTAGSVGDDFERLLVLGLNMSIFIIFLIHVGVSIGLLPPTGIPLPFISFGGWSLSANLFAMGIILQASRKRII